MAIKSSSGKNIRDFNLVSILCDTNGDPVTWDNPIQIMPRYTSGSTASTSTFDDSSDYADASNHNVSGSGYSYDFRIIQMPPTPDPWYNYVYGGTAGRRGSSSSANNTHFLQEHGGYMSLYMDVHVGDGPHPGVGTNYAHISLLTNQYGAYHQWHLGGPSAVYTTPRTIFGTDAANHNFKISGQNYGTSRYSQIFAMAEMQDDSWSGGRFLRLINWGGGASGKSRVTVTGAQLVIHGRTGSNTGADA